MDKTTVQAQQAPAGSGYALLIGVNDYKTFNSSGDDDLQGSRNDVLMWHWFCREVLGLPPANIVMLTSPQLTPADFGDGAGAVPAENLGEANEAEIQKRLDWLLQWTRDGRAPGLLTFSGHGAWVNGKGPVLCAADANSSLAQGVVALRDLGPKIAAAKAARTTTVVLDCCHVIGSAGAGGIRKCTALPHAGTADGVTEDHADFGVSDRVFLAARPGQHGYQARLGHRVHGALSFALVAAAEQWRATNGALDATHKQLFKRAKKVLRSLRMKQSPRLRVPFDPTGRSEVRKLPFFGLHAGATTRRPDAPRANVQIDPSMSLNVNVGCLYTVTDQNDNPFSIFSCGINTGSYNGGTEYWGIGGNTSLRSATKLTFTPSTQTSSPGTLTTAPAYMVSMPTNPGWESMPLTWAPPTSILWSSDCKTALDLSQTASSSPAVTWYMNFTSSPTGYAISSSGTTTLSTGNAPTSPLTSNWYRLRLSYVNPTWSNAAPSRLTATVNGTSTQLQARNGACALASMNSALYLAVNNNGSVTIYKSTDGFSWSEYAPSKTLTNATQMYLAADSSTSTLYLSIGGNVYPYTSSSGWGSSLSVTGLVGSPTAITMFSGALYTFSSIGRIYSYNANNSPPWSMTVSWGSTSRSAPASAPAPTPAFVVPSDNSALFMVGQDGAGAAGAWSSSSWAPEIGTAGFELSRPQQIVAAEYNGALVEAVLLNGGSGVQMLTWQGSISALTPSPGPTLLENMQIVNMALAGLDGNILVLVVQDSNDFLFCQYAI